MKDLYHNLGVVHLLDSQDIANSDTESDILDLADFKGAVISVNIGDVNTLNEDADGVTPVLQESDTTADTDFSDVDSGDILGAFALVDGVSADEKDTQYVGYIGSKRYIRVNLDVKGSPVAVPISVDGILGYPGEAPVTAPDPITAT
ncbi:MAG: hypothetical protein ACOC78_00295 [Actinomycetota bacterium]